MPDYVIQGCTVQDGADVARNNMSSFWEDQNWRIVWKHSTLPRVIEACSARSPRNLLKDRALLRHFKAVDPDTGKFLGYARWKLPPGYHEDKDGNPTWPEGQTPDVTSEERAKIEEVADAADWNPDDEGDDLDAPITRRKIEYLARKEYLCKRHIFFTLKSRLSYASQYNSSRTDDSDLQCSTSSRCTPSTKEKALGQPFSSTELRRLER